MDMNEVTGFCSASFNIGEILLQLGRYSFFLLFLFLNWYYFNLLTQKPDEILTPRSLLYFL
jgi:hypothetical protein